MTRLAEPYLSGAPHRATGVGAGRRSLKASAGGAGVPRRGARKTADGPQAGRLLRSARH
ncbi:hypothetical protein LJK87_39245 [Paenibacillus sp. P25]|nr:hypothetical protein LJK87_39245 [Paenibacillus sp. P25]